MQREGFTTISAQKRGEFIARDFLGEDKWKEWKTDYDELMGYRKTIKGKPDEYQMIIIQMNDVWIKFYKRILFNNYERTDK